MHDLILQPLRDPYTADELAYMTKRPLAEVEAELARLEREGKASGMKK